MWDGHNHLKLPVALAKAYIEILAKRDLLEEAFSISKRGLGGGESEEETIQHFVHKFDGSCARVELAVLDPKDNLGSVSNYFIRAFSGGRIRLLDIPCGCGAASAALLTTVAELRRQEVIPSMPLEVYLTGGDIAETAICYARSLFEDLNKPLQGQSVFLKSHFSKWDIVDAAGTTSLVKDWLSLETDCTKSFLLISNFTKFLGKDRNLENSEERLGEIFRWAEVNKATIVWVEPIPKDKTKERFQKWFGKELAALTGRLGLPTGPSARLTSVSKYVQPLRCSDPSVRLLLFRLEGPSHDSESGNIGSARRVPI